jgi:hypothetical protein
VQAVSTFVTSVVLLEELGGVSPVKIPHLAKYALAITTGAAMLAACSNNGGSPLAPDGGSSTGMGTPQIGRPLIVNGALVTAARPSLTAPDGPISPNGKRKKTYQYFSSCCSSNTYLELVEFDYPKGDAPIGTIHEVSAGGMCTRTGRGTFWLAKASEVDEFKVGGTSPITTIHVPNGATSCAINPATGDLVATANYAEVWLFKKARGPGQVISTGLRIAWFAGYDNKGDLFVDGTNYSQTGFALVELKKGRSVFQTITTSNYVVRAGAVQWDGKYVAVTDPWGGAIYRYTVSGTTATLKGTVPLSGSSACLQTWIAKTVVYCPDVSSADAKVYKYPAGGSPIATLTGAPHAEGSIQVEK